jgi:nicotinate dehydrogenase subunit A
MPRVTEIQVNDQTRSIDADDGRSLLSVLRDDLDLTGCKYGCGEAQCGACTVLVDGEPVRSCVTPVTAAKGKKLTTIEGLAAGDSLHPVQEAFLEADALQCGYCTPGMILSTVALLQKHPDPADADIARLMNGNICRCCVYPRIKSAIQIAATSMRQTP